MSLRVVVVAPHKKATASLAELFSKEGFLVVALDEKGRENRERAGQLFENSGAKSIRGAGTDTSDARRLAERLLIISIAETMGQD